MNEESILSTNPRFPGYAQRQEEGEWLVYRSGGAQVGFISATTTPEIFDVASVPHGPSGNTMPVEVEGFQKALAYCLEKFRSIPT